MVVIATVGEEGCLVSVARGDFHADDLAIEVDGAFQVGNLEMYVSDSWCRCHRSIVNCCR